MCGGGRLPTGAPDSFGTKDFVLLYYSIIKEHRPLFRLYVLKSVFIEKHRSQHVKIGGGERVRTDGLLRARQALSQLSYTPNVPELVGLGGLEPPTSRLSGVRSNQLSYRPELKNELPDHLRITHFVVHNPYHKNNRCKTGSSYDCW